MNIPRFLTALTVVNLALFVFLVVRVAPAAANDAAPVLRGSSLEIVDARGKVRASIKVQPAERRGETSYPETVMLRLIDPNGRPTVKMGSSERGAALGFVGQTDVTHVLLRAEDLGTSLTLTNGDGREQVITP